MYANWQSEQCGCWEVPTKSRAPDTRATPVRAFGKSSECLNHHQYIDPWAHRAIVSHITYVVSCPAWLALYEILRINPLTVAPSQFICTQVVEVASGAMQDTSGLLRVQNDAEMLVMHICACCYLISCFIQIIMRLNEYLPSRKGDHNFTSIWLRHLDNKWDVPCSVTHQSLECSFEPTSIGLWRIPKTTLYTGL